MDPSLINIEGVDFTWESSCKSRSPLLNLSTVTSETRGEASVENGAGDHYPSTKELEDIALLSLESKLELLRIQRQISAAKCEAFLAELEGCQAAASPSLSKATSGLPSSPSYRLKTTEETAAFRRRSLDSYYDVSYGSRTRQNSRSQGRRLSKSHSTNARRNPDPRDAFNVDY